LISLPIETAGSYITIATDSDAVGWPDPCRSSLLRTHSESTPPASNAKESFADGSLEREQASQKFSSRKTNLHMRVRACLSSRKPATIEIFL